MAILLKDLYKKEKGQSINEVFLGIGIAMIFITAIIVVISAALSATLKSRHMQIAINFSNETTSRITSLSLEDWVTVYNLSRDPQTYYLLSSGGSLATSSGSEFIILETGGITYERYFTVSDVVRDANQAIAVSGTTDPSTLRINTMVAWQEGGATTSISFSKYITRHNKQFTTQQTDWSDGPGQSGSVSSFNARFDQVSSTVDTSSVIGSIRLNSGNTSGDLVSSVFDTQVASGSAFNVLIWQGNLPANTTVKFQIASSGNSSGPWNFLGSDGTSVTYYQDNPNVSIKIRSINHNNKRYIKYKIYLDSTDISANPRVDDIVITYNK